MRIRHKKVSYHKRLGGEKAYKRVSNTSTGKLVAQSLLMGTYGSLKYHQAMASGQIRARSVGEAFIMTNDNTLAGYSLSVLEPRMKKVKIFLY